MNSQNHIFVIDDDEMVLATLNNILFCAGFTVKTYHSAQQFLADLKAVTVKQGCIIVDLQMPELNGLELQCLLKEKGLSLPIIFLSGAGDITAAVEAMANGAFHFLQKPIKRNELINTINSAIAKFANDAKLTEPTKQARQVLSLLSERELEIATLTAEGLSATAIAETIHISIRTVEAHKASIFNKLNIHSIAQLTRLVVLSNYQLN